MQTTMRFAFFAGCMAVLAACQSGGSDTPASGSNCDSSIEYCGTVPRSANACTDDQYWPFVMQSGQRPLTVHYSRLTDEQTATEMLAQLEHAWTTQVDVLGFAPPLDDHGNCGDDGRYDVFIWRGIDGAFVDGIEDNPQTAHDDYSTYMAIDTSGSYGGALLDTTLAHEFNHAVQASDDWWENASFFEMSATFVEALVYPQQDDYFYTINDFQRHPDWSLFYEDNYRTWYMYGAAMYLHFLKERYFPLDPGFISRIWRMMRNDMGSDRPDFMDAMRAVLLSERGVDFDDSVIEFMQWRWFVAELDDGGHFIQGAAWPRSVSFLDIDASTPAIAVDLSAMSYGASYLRFANNSAEELLFAVNLESNDLNVIWHLTTVYGEAIANSLSVAPQSTVVLVATVIPASSVSAASLTFEMRTASLTLDAQ